MEATLFTDADNTLWDTDSVFAHAQLQLLEEVENLVRSKLGAFERLAFVRAVDQHLAELHHSGLRYPPRLLALSIARLLDGGGPVEAAARSVVRGTISDDAFHAPAGEIERQFLAAIRVAPALRAGVRDGLDALSKRGCPVVVVTEGSREHVDQRVRELGLSGFITRIIEAPKRPELYARVRKLTSLPQHAFMIGDQLDRDIAPAKVAGLTTIYFAGGFHPKWSPNIDDIQPDYVVDDFAEAASIVLADSNLGLRTGTQ